MTIIHLPNHLQQEITRLSLMSNHPKRKHCCIVYNYQTQTIISEGYNHMTSRTTSIHAEQMALRKLAHWKDFTPTIQRDCILIVARFNTVFGNSKPCAKCQSLISRFHFRAILYTTNETKLYDLTIKV